MAESLVPEIIPGLVAVEYIGPERQGGPKKGSIKNVYPIDAKELLTTREYKLVENGAVEAARLNANPLRRVAHDPTLVVTEVTGIEGQVHMAETEKDAEKAIEAADHDGDATKIVAEPGKAPGNPTGSKAPEPVKK